MKKTHSALVKYECSAYGKGILEERISYKTNKNASLQSYLKHLKYVIETCYHGKVISVTDYKID